MDRMRVSEALDTGSIPVGRARTPCLYGSLGRHDHGAAPPRSDSRPGLVGARPEHARTRPWPGCGPSGGASARHTYPADRG
uniref:Protein of unassigned function n=1 Tax=Parastrongyloides trichosuri TaxID=131310 RepID=A0A0N5A5V9_PARTI